MRGGVPDKGANMTVEYSSFDIKEGTYDWCVKSFHALRKSFGLNIKVHNDDGKSEQGDIFLFNHFARFETIIPPYIIHHETGAYCRTVADHALFEGNERIGNFMRSVGAVPNNMPGLLPFLAAEILRGRKVIIFPEGGMVKDRRVMDDDGGYSVYSRTADERRKHHRGAAVLALTLEIFKRRIRTLEKRGDQVRIKRWVKALDLPSEEALLKAAAKPTSVVPGTITFYPLHIDENAFSRAADLLSSGLSSQLVDELVVEGNILLKETDMDIRLGDPLQPQKKWTWWERMLLERYFRKISSLDELFSLREKQVESWPEKMLARCITKETKRIRDEASEALYAGISVNLSHLASYLIFRLIKQGHREIDLRTFHVTLYLALKNLQAVPGANLHRSLCWPDRYRGLVDGQCPELDHFLATAKSAGLVGRTNQAYHFLAPLIEELDFDDIRIGNPLMVYANEAAPVHEVRETVDKAFQDSNKVTEQELASFLFDDELRAHDWNRKYFTREQYAEINTKETATMSGAPYLLLPKNSAKVGVLLIHGLLSSPAQWQNYAQHLCGQGVAVMGVRLAGHGTSPWDLHGRTWRDWLASIERAYRLLGAFSEQMIVVGFSTGGALSLILGSEWPGSLAGIASINAPIEFRDRKMAFVPLIHGFNKVANWLPMVDELLPFRDNNTEQEHINYRSIPIPALFEMGVMTEDLQRRLPEIQAPVLLVQSDEDPVVHPDSATSIYGKLATDCSLKWVASDRHEVIDNNDLGVWTLLDDFIYRVTDQGDDETPKVSEVVL